MRAGKLDRTIDIFALGTGGVDDYGTPIPSGETLATVRAQIVQASTEEFLRGYGETDATVIIFRIRWLADVTTKCGVGYEGRALNIREIKELGRRRGLELRCEEVRT